MPELRRISALLACLALPLSAPAQQALVTTQDAAALEIGQAFLAHYGPQCYAILPTHVVHEAARPALLREATPPMQREKKPPLLGETHDAVDLGGDIGIAKVSGAIAADCGTGALTVQRSVDRLLQQGRLATLRSINGDGTVAQLAVAIIDDDGRGTLRVQPTHPDNPIRKGLSGSLLMIDGVMAGMLLSVHARSGIGTVARIDALMAKVDGHLMGQAATSGGSAVTRAPSAKAGKSGLSPRVVGWSALPLDDSRRAANLTEAGEATPWASQPSTWPVTIDLAAGEGVVVVSAVVLDGRGVDAGQLPRQVEVFVNVSGEPRGWRAVTSETLTYKDGVAQVRFAPLRVRLVRLNFSGTMNGGKVITLRRVELRQD
jgi:hypothetical protein